MSVSFRTSTKKMRFLTACKILRFFGVLPITFSVKTMTFYTNIRLAVFCYVYFLVIELYSFIEWRLHAKTIVKNVFLRNEEDLWVENHALLIDFASVICLNITTFITIACKRHKQCNLLNYLNKEKLCDRNIRTGKLWYIVLFLHFFALPILFTKQFGLTIFGVMRGIAIIYHTIQYGLGNAYEIMVADCLRERLQKLRQETNEMNVKENPKFIENFEKMWKKTRKFFKLFASNKLPYMTVVTVMISIRLFFNYSRLFGNYMSVMWILTLIRQSITYISFVTCYYWDQLIMEVSYLITF